MSETIISVGVSATCGHNDKSKAGASKFDIYMAHLLHTYVQTRYQHSN